MANDGDDRTAVLPIDGDAAFDDDQTMVAGSGGSADDGEDVTVVRPRAPTRARLVVRDASGAVQELPLGTPDVLIGRGAGCDVTLTNPEVSRQHARIVERGDAHVFVAVGTRGNTYVNGQAVTGEHVLRHGDVLLLASEQLIYAELDDTPVVGGPAAAPSPPRSGLALAAVALGLLVVGGGAWVLLQPKPAPPPPAPVAAVLPPPAAAPAPVEPPPPPVAAAPAVEPPAAAAEARAEQVRKLVYRGDVAFIEKRYLTPPDDSAVFLYTEVLKLDPENARARAQIGAIADQYVAWAEEARARRDRGRARLMADKATYVVEQAATVGITPEAKARLQVLAADLGAR